MAELAQLVLSGLSTGSIYALAAIGFTLLWQAAQTVNFAQGEFVVLPGFAVLVALKWFGLPLWLSLLFGFVFAVLVLGYLFKRVVVDPMLPNTGLPLIIATMALSIFLKEGMKLFYGAEAQPFPDLFPQTTLDVAGAVVSVQDVLNLVVSVAVVVLLTLFLDRTRTGRCMQATAQNPAVAVILGIDTRRMVLYAFLINAGLAALASVLISPIFLAKFSNGEQLGLIAFIAAIVGGFNRIRGAIAGGLLLGVLDNLIAAYVTAQYRAAVPLLLLIGVILWRPYGLFGTSEGRQV